MVVAVVVGVGACMAQEMYGGHWSQTKAQVAQLKEFIFIVTELVADAGESVEGTVAAVVVEALPVGCAALLSNATC